MKACGVAQILLSICMSLFASSFCAFVKYLAILAIDILSLVVCWNHIDGVVVWSVSPYVLSYSSLRMALTQCTSICCAGEGAHCKCVSYTCKFICVEEMG